MNLDELIKEVEKTTQPLNCLWSITVCGKHNNFYYAKIWGTGVPDFWGYGKTAYDALMLTYKNFYAYGLAMDKIKDPSNA